jgi:phosphate-selective porin OprO/OprP
VSAASLRGETMLLVALALAVAVRPASGEEPPKPTESREEDLEDRLRRLEEANRRMQEQYEMLLQRGEAERQQAEGRYRDLEAKYESLKERLREPPSPAPTPAFVPEFRGEFDPDRPDALPPPTSTGELFPEGLPPIGGRNQYDARYGRGGPWLRGRLDEGFQLLTPDEEFTLDLHALLQADGKLFVPGYQQPARSGIYFPRIRFYFEGRATKALYYEISVQRSVEGTFDVLDANVDLRLIGERLQLKFGRFIVPYSYAWYDHLEQYFIVPERALYPLNFGLSRQGGLMTHGQLFDQRVEYALGGFDGHLVGLADDNTTREGVGYLNFRPFLGSDRLPGLRYLNVGMSGGGGFTDVPFDPLPLRTSVQASENDVAARAASAQFLEFNPDVLQYGSRAQVAMHLAWYVRRFSLESEWQTGRFQYMKTGTRERPVVPVTGFHVTGSYFLTGETVRDRGTVVPLRPFDLRRGRRGLGAFEVFGRYSQLSLGETVFRADLADRADWTRDAYMTDIGVNWYLNRFVKIYAVWQHTAFGSPVLLHVAPERRSGDDDLFWLRVQVYF